MSVPVLVEKTFCVTFKSQAAVRWLVTDEQLLRQFQRQAERIADFGTDGLLPIVEVAKPTVRTVPDDLPRWFCGKCNRLWHIRGMHPDCEAEPSDMTEVKP